MVCIFGIAPLTAPGIRAGLTHVRITYESALNFITKHKRRNQRAFSYSYLSPYQRRIFFGGFSPRIKSARRRTIMFMVYGIMQMDSSSFQSTIGVFLNVVNRCFVYYRVYTSGECCRLRCRMRN